MLLALGACTGGSSGGGSLSDDESIDGFNGPLTGHIYLRDSVIYLETGARYQLMNLDGVGPVSTTANEDYRYGITFGCPNNLPEDVDCIQVYNQDGYYYHTHIDRQLFPTAPITRSDDRSIILYSDDGRTAYFVENDFAVPEQSPEAVGERRFVQRAAWGPDNSVYYTRNYRLYRAESSSQPEEDDTLIWDFTDTSLGIPTEISVHPDGNVIAVSRYLATTAESTETDTIWRVYPDEDRAEPFITGSTIQAVRYPNWSHDGRFLVAAVNPSEGNNQGWIPGLQQGLVAFDASYFSHQITATGPLTQPGRFEIRARCGRGDSCAGSGEDVVGVEAVQVGAWVYPNDPN